MASLASLGVVFDSSGAKRGGAEISRELKKVATDAKSTAVALDGVSRSASTIGDSATKTRALSAATKELSATTRTAASAADIFAQGIARENAIFDELRKSISAGRDQIAQIKNASASAAGGLTAAATAGSRFTAALAPWGGPIGVGIIGAMTALPMVMDLFRERSERAEKAARSYREELERLSPAAIQAARASEEALQARIRSTPMTAGARASAIGESQSRVQVLDQVIGSNQIENARKFDEVLKKNRENALDAAEALRLLNTSGEKNAETFKRASAQWVDTTGKGRSYLQAIRELDTNAIELTRSIDRAVTSDRAFAASQKASADAARAAEKAVRDSIRAQEQQLKNLEDFREWVRKGKETLEEMEKVERKRIQSLADTNAAIAERIGRGGAELQATRAQIAALFESEKAYDAVTDAQEREKAIAEAAKQIKTGNLLLDQILVANLGEEIEKRQELLRVLSALHGLSERARRDPFDLTDAVGNVGRFADGMARVVASTGDVAGAFANVSRELQQAIGGAGQLLGQLSRAQQSGVYKDLNGVDRNVGFRGALAGKAGFEGTIGAVSSALGVVSGFAQIADAVDLFGSRARERAERLRQAAHAFNDALASFAIADTTDLQERLRQNVSGASALVQQAAAASGVRGGDGSSFKSVEEIEAFAAVMSRAASQSRKGGESLYAFAERLRELAAQARVNEEQIRNRIAIEAAMASRDLDARRATALGMGETAARLREQSQAERELNEARARYGESSDYVTKLHEVIAVELAAADAARQLAAAEKARQQAQQAYEFGLDAIARRQSLNGDDRGALITRTTIGNNSALAQAEALVKAGTITADMFEELKRILGDEMVRTIADFDAALAKASRQTQEDLSVRELVAKGMSKEAEQVRQAIADRRELEGVTDENIRQIILNVQQLETEARARAEAAALQQQLLEQNADIDRRTLEALRTLDPAKADALEATLRETDRAKELAAAANDAVRARYAELYAMQDAASAQAKLTAELERQKAAAEALANFSSSVDVDYLRATGRTFEADARQLQDDRDRRLKEAGELGASQDTIEKITAIFDAKYSKLIADTMNRSASDASASAAAGPLDPTVKYSNDLAFSATSETTSLRMIDVQLSQLSVLRSIDGKVGGANGGGITVQITISGSPLVAQTPQELANTLAGQILPVLDEYSGRKVGVENRRLGTTALT